MDRVKRNIYFLRYLSTLANSVQRKALLETASADQITAVAEIAYNILGGVFELTDSELSSLQRYKCVIRKLASRYFRTDEKRSVSLRNSVAAKHLLTVITEPCIMDSDGDKTFDSYTSDAVPTAYSESDEIDNAAV